MTHVEISASHNKFIALTCTALKYTNGSRRSGTQLSSQVIRYFVSAGNSLALRHWGE